jgi:Astacin (Peptidase family M12A)
MGQHKHDDGLRSALKQIAQIANEYADGGSHRGPEHAGAGGVCKPKQLPKALLAKAAHTAIQVNPVNRPALSHLAQLAPQADPRMAISVLTTKYWGPKALRLTVSFLDSPPDDLRNRILSHMNAWNKSANVQFVESNSGGQVRIAFEGGVDGGYWSYVGTDILHIAAGSPTMNLEGFTMNMRDSEFYRVVRHETGHTLGFPHEHMRKELVALIDPQKAYDYYWQTQGWIKQDVDQQVLTPLDDMDVMGTPPDQTSIMCYQVPGSITHSGEPITGGTDINETDYGFAGSIYPKNGQAQRGRDGVVDEGNGMEKFVSNPDLASLL